MFDLTGKKALITGASGGIGAAIARLFHQRGATVLLHGTKENKLQELQKELGENSYICPADLASLESIKNLALEAEKMLGNVDILVNNAGITKDSLFMRMKDKDWSDVLDVNLTSVFSLTKALIANMVKNRFGRIVNISSVVAFTGNPGQVNYCSSKAAMIGFTKALAQELAGRQITVNAIAPGFIQSMMTEKLNEKQKEAILSSIPMKRMGDAVEIANAALYLASDESSYITGQTIHVNGGLAMV